MAWFEFIIGEIWVGNIEASPSHGIQGETGGATQVVRNLLFDKNCLNGSAARWASGPIEVKAMQTLMINSGFLSFK